MGITRTMLLMLGPFALVGACYGLSTPRASAEIRSLAERAWKATFPEDGPEPEGTEFPDLGKDEVRPRAESRRPSLFSRPAIIAEEVTFGSSDDEVPLPATRQSPQNGHRLISECERTAERVRGKLTNGCSVIVRPPFILGGDGTESQLEEAYDELIAPIARTLAHCYFDTPPNGPITVLLFSSDEAFQEHAQLFDRRRRQEYYGYYLRAERRVMLNTSTGGGTVAHELTHALAHYDFPEMPEWFDEGLASLHEEAEFSDDGSTIRGRSNWRINHLLLGLRRGQVRTIEELIESPQAVRAKLDAVDYAHARYVCLFLQERKLLADYYRGLRDSNGSDPTGRRTLESLIAPKSLDEFDREFRQWAVKFRPISWRLLFETQRL